MQKFKVTRAKNPAVTIRHEAVRHLILNGVLTLEFIRSEKNLADPLTKGLNRKVVLESSRGIGLRPV